MFETQRSDTHTDRSSRRTFLVAAAAAAGGAALLWVRRPHAALADDTQSPPGKPVTIVLFDDNGKRLRTVTMGKVVKSSAAWQRQLSANAYDITRLADTEIAFSGSLWNQHQRGLYRCICCDTALFSSNTKFESGTGWPSFWEPIARENVAELEDSTLGMIRTAVSCKLCDAHLGHVFNDGPNPTGLRYCMNSASLRFLPYTA